MLNHDCLKKIALLIPCIIKSWYIPIQKQIHYFNFNSDLSKWQYY